MAVVFVSHASADKALVDEFVDTVLRNGCDLDPKEIFYTSGADTGVPDGQDLLGYVRDQVGDTGLVVTMLTPTFQTRPVCVAEMGAAWGSTGKLFPLLVPGMERSRLDGVLSAQLVEYMGEEGALDRLHDRIVEITGRKVDTATWTRAKRKWLKMLSEIIAAGGVPSPDVVTADEHHGVLAERDELAEALDAAEGEVEDLKAKLAAVSALKDKQAVKQVTLPTQAVDRFAHLVKDARTSLNGLGHRQIAEAIVATCSDQHGLIVPMDDQWERDTIYALAERGLLVNTVDATYQASDDFTTHTDALAAVEAAIEAVPDEPDFDEWFADEYGAQPNMSNYTILQKVFLD